MRESLTVAPRVQLVLLYSSFEAREKAFIAFNDLGLYFRTQRVAEDGIRIFHGDSICLILSLFQHNWANDLIAIVI